MALLWALAPITRLLTTLTAGHLDCVAGVQPLLHLYLLSKLTMRKVRTGRQRLSLAARLADNVTIVQYSFTLSITPYHVYLKYFPCSRVLNIFN